MPKPVTPLVGCDVFILNEKNEVLLIRRADNGYWALPGGCQDLGETPADCAIREAREETGYEVELTELLGVFSSQCYEYKNYPWKDNEFSHVMFAARIIGGSPTLSSETTEIAWFSEEKIPALSDGNAPRIQWGFRKKKEPGLPAHFE
jgi:ADP-ribose pyrophosphatase YjhB (NUDIX family)